MSAGDARRAALCGMRGVRYPSPAMASGCHRRAMQAGVPVVTTPPARCPRGRRRGALRPLIPRRAGRGCAVADRRAAGHARGRRPKRVVARLGPDRRRPRRHLRRRWPTVRAVRSARSAAVATRALKPSSGAEGIGRKRGEAAVHVALGLGPARALRWRPESCRPARAAHVVLARPSRAGDAVYPATSPNPSPSQRRIRRPCRITSASPR